MLLNRLNGAINLTAKYLYMIFYMMFNRQKYLPTVLKKNQSYFKMFKTYYCSSCLFLSLKVTRKKYNTLQHTDIHLHITFVLKVFGIYVVGITKCFTIK